MHVDREIVVWAASGMMDVLRDADFGLSVPVRLVAGEAEVLAAFPPNWNPMAYFVDLEAVRHASVAALALIVARPITWPPVIVFGVDREGLMVVSFNPNSRVLVTPVNAARVLGEAARYWTRVNVPLE